MQGSTKGKVHSLLLLLSRKVNRKPLTMRRATGLGIERHNRPSIYATMADKTNLPMPLPHFQMNLPFATSSAELAGTIDLPLSLSGFHLMLAMHLLACFLRIRIAKLTNRCSPNVNTVGPILHSCCKVSLNYFRWRMKG